MLKHTLLGLAALAGLSAPAQAWVTVHVEHGADQAVAVADAPHVETFDGGAGGSFTSSFGGSDVTATFTGFEAGQGHGVVRGQASIKLDRAVRFFGLRAAALDGNNTIELFRSGRSLGFYNLVGYSPGPAFVNFLSDEAFDEIRFVQSTGRFELDNVTVANVSAVPEPAAWALFILGFGALGALLRSRRSAKLATT